MRRNYRIIEGKIVEAESLDGPINVFVMPDDEERRYLVDDLKIDEHTLRSALDPDELSRIEFEPEHVAMIYKRPKNFSAEDKFLFKVSSSGLFIFKDRLVIVLPEDSPMFDGKMFLKVGTLNDLTLKIIYKGIFHFLEHLKVINTISDELERKINSAMENRYLINLFTLEKSLVYYLNAINSNGVLIEKMKMNAQKIGLLQDEAEFLDDVMIENNQCYRQAEIYSNILAGLMDARVSIVSNNLNVLMKTLNIITILIMVPTFVVSAFSMNVRIPLAEHSNAFYVILGLALLSMAAVYVVYKRKKW